MSSEFRIVFCLLFLPVASELLYDSSCSDTAPGVPQNLKTQRNREMQLRKKRHVGVFLAASELSWPLMGFTWLLGLLSGPNLLWGCSEASPGCPTTKSQEQAKPHAHVNVWGSPQLPVSADVFGVRNARLSRRM